MSCRMLAVGTRKGTKGIDSSHSLMVGGLASFFFLCTLSRYKSK